MATAARPIVTTTDANRSRSPPTITGALYKIYYDEKAYMFFTLAITTFITSTIPKAYMFLYTCMLVAFPLLRFTKIDRRRLILVNAKRGNVNLMLGTK